MSPTRQKIGGKEKQIVVDLSSVQVVDATSRKLLSQMHGWGTRLSGGSLMIGPLIEEITNAASCSDSKSDQIQ
jgi:hypothetical protein